MAVKLIANYSKRLGLPGYSSHQFAVSIETELVNTDEVADEAARVYRLLQTNVDEQIRSTGFVPPDDYGTRDADPPAANGSNGHDSPSEEKWRCSDKQRELILKLVDEHSLDKQEVDHLARQRFGKGVKQLNKMEASGLIDELLETHGGKSRRRSSGRAYAKGGRS